jgi:hypothetical protein
MKSKDTINSDKMVKSKINETLIKVSRKKSKIKRIRTELEKNKRAKNKK